MNKKTKLILLAIVLLAGIFTAIIYLHGTNIAVLNPKGPIARQQRNLIFFTVALVSIVIVPVFALTIIFSWRYREGNKKARYSPELVGSRKLETIWWLVPSAIILVLSVVTWRSSHQLDPSRPISKTHPAMTIQVVAMNWKWLFIYPSQNIATVNYVKIPVNQPIDFQITSDAPMNSFWIPQLGGQIYAMAGMTTHMNLEATQAGDYRGSSANISGRGFAGMDFTASAGSPAEFSYWVKAIRQQNRPLNLDSYNLLAKPSTNNYISYYSSAQPGLFDNVVMRYMMPGMENYIQ